MNKFLIKISWYFILTIGLVFIAGLLANGYTDPFYLRFTHPKQHSLILGTSRSAQGIVPEILNEQITSKEVLPLYNYSFTITHSPFGETYFHAIKKKLEDKSSRGMFIISVDPWSIGTRNENIEDSLLFDEKQTFLGKLLCFNGKPNFDYLLRMYNEPFLNLIFNRMGEVPQIFLHDDGWLETSPNMSDKSVRSRTQSKIEQYRNSHAVKYRKSNQRITSLKSLISFLKTRGRVCLVRIPVYSEMLEIEKLIFPEFDVFLSDFGRNQGVPYFNFTKSSESFVFTDGNHLYKKSSIEFSRLLADSINTYISNQSRIN